MRSHEENPPQVRILMGFFNGAAHLAPQLDSIAAQKDVDWTLMCSDDGSTDDSLAIIDDFSTSYPERLRFAHGPRGGFSANYMAMIRDLPKAPGWIAFADQDDIWLPDKIYRAVATLTPFGETPALYCGRRMEWFAETGRRIPSRRVLRPCTLRNGLIENVASGNTIVLNPAAADLARRAARRTGPVFAHDWWLYLLLTACGGIVRFDNGEPRILYRQHRANAIGSGRGVHSQWRRKTGVLAGEFSARIDGNLDALAAIEDLVTPASRQTIKAFHDARLRRGTQRITALWAVQPFRQSAFDTLGFWGAAAIGRV